MARPAKAYFQIVSEQKSHRTKSELETRKKAEESLLSGKKMVCRIKKQKDETAYSEFKRIEKLLTYVDKNDALYEGIINRYCVLFSECMKHEDGLNKLHKDILELEEAYTLREALAFGEYVKMKSQMRQQIINLDIQLMKKRTMLLAIEKEMAMTIAAALRMVPKKPAEEEDPNADLF